MEIKEERYEERIHAQKEGDTKANEYQVYFIEITSVWEGHTIRILACTDHSLVTGSVSEYSPGTRWMNECLVCRSLVVVLRLEENGYA